LPPAEGEIFQVALLSTHAQANGDDDEEIEKKDETIDRQFRVHPAVR